MKISIGVSLRHIHLNKEDYNVLFDSPITEKESLNQPGQYAANETVTLESKNRKIENVRIIGPCRNYTQVEISRTDAYYLKINPPVRESGNLNDADILDGNYGTIVTMNEINDLLKYYEFEKIK